MKEGNTIYIALSDANFQQQVIKSKKTILVEFGASWCGPCHIIAPLIEELIAAYKGQIKMGKLDIDHNKRVVKEYGIQELPTFLFFNNGQVIDHIIGIVPRECLIDKLHALLEKNNG